ncbi:MAG TPA: RNA polymerase subunit sigma-70 [Planctomycetaceae bacterium]|nr:RNA polymerase subunit sigma-70 [Planctomycetaceae bacterium]
MSQDAIEQRVREGDPDALAALLEKERDALIGFLRRITGEHLLRVVTIDDLYQEVAASALASLDRAASPTLNPAAWLRQLCRRRVTDAHRFHFGADKRAAARNQALSGDRSALQFEDLLIASITSPSEAVSRDIRLSRTHAAIQSLGHDASTVIRLRYLENKSFKDIAVSLGKSEVSVRVLLSRSLRKLEQMLREEKDSGRDSP